MVELSRSFSATEYFEGTELEEFQDAEPAASVRTIVYVDKSKNRIRVIEHTYPLAMSREWSHRSWSFDMQFQDWADVVELTKTLERYQQLPDDVTLRKRPNITHVETSIMEYYPEEDLERRVNEYDNVEVAFRVSNCTIELAMIPEPDNSEDVLFPSIPVGRSFAREGAASDTANLKRLIELLKEAERGLEQKDTTEPIFSQEAYNKLSSTDYGHEVIHHAEDGDTCVESGLLHLALSSYIHAIEWAAICYLKEQDVDIIQQEKDGNLYNFAGGHNSILEELRQHSDIDQKTTSQLRSMNRAERRWMAHHKSGEVLPEEVEAIRARLRSLVRDLFFNEAG